MKTVSRHPVRLQKLFLVALTLKVAFSGLSVWFDSAWTMGFAIPLVVMACYIVLGWRRPSDDVSDEKFADSCYYLGFIFTITSIVASLFDLPSIGTHITDIGIRFGAAMVSTVLGLGVRVYLVGFREETSDAIQAVEDSLVDASKRFREQLGMAVERLQEFDEKVSDARKLTIERLEVQLTDVAKTFGAKLESVFGEIAGQHQKLTQDTSEDLHEITARLAVAIDAQTEAFKTQLARLEERVNGFTDAVASRLEKTTFPDDFFVTSLNDPIKRLSTAVEEMSVDVRAAADDIKNLNKEFAPTIRAAKKRAEEMGIALQGMKDLAQVQEFLLGMASKNNDGVEKLVSAVQALAENIKAGSKENGEQLQKLTTEQHERLREVSSSIEAIATSLEANSRESQTGLRLLSDSNASAIHELVAGLQQVSRDIAEVSSTVHEQVEKVAGLNREAAQGLERHIEHLAQQLERNSASSHQHLAELGKTLDTMRLRSTDEPAGSTTAVPMPLVSPDVTMAERPAS